MSPFQESFHPFDYLYNLTASRRPTFVGLSFRNWDEAGFSYESDDQKTFLRSLRHTVSTLRRSFPRTPMLLGGSGFSVDPHYLLNMLDLQYGIRGPGENSIRHFAKLVANSKNRPDLNSQVSRAIQAGSLPGFVFRSGSDKFEIGSAAREYVEPPFRQVDSASHYSNRLLGGTIPIRTKTGCTQMCSYCVVPQIEPLSLRKVADVLREIRVFVEMGGSDRIFFADGEFNLPSANRFRTILTSLAKNFGNNIGWFSYLHPVTKFDQQTVKLILKSGCRGVSVTIDSFSDPVLESMGKGFRCSVNPLCSAP